MSGEPMVLEAVVCRENMQRAWQRVRSNRGAAGVDGLTIDQTAERLRDEWPRIREDLLEGRYTPQPVRRVDIPKPGGGIRTLGIPTVTDRLIRQAIGQVLQPHFDPTFSASSFGYRPGRSAQDAVKRGRDHIAAGNRWMVDMDLARFFDRVNHDVLMSRLARRIEDKRLLSLIDYSDRGVQYLSIRYTQRLTDAGIDGSVGSTGNSYDNALAETIIGLYKTEVIHQKGPWREASPVEYATLDWVDWFNHRRLLGSIGHVPPAELEAAYYQQITGQAIAA